MNDDERLLLAELMGRWDFDWNRSRAPKDWTDDEVRKLCSFDPFTDANDDYAVLEWVRNNWQGQDGYYGHWNQFARSIWWSWDEYDVTIPYQVGDYARAALAVLQQQERK